MHKKIPKIFIFIDQYNKEIFESNNTNIGVIYRNYNKVDKKELVKIAKGCKRKRFPLYIANNQKLALKIKADGVYIPSFNKNQRFFNFESKKIRILGSAHNQREIHNKISQSCSVIFLAPIFYVKKRNYFLDIHRFNFLTHINKISFIALGGVDEKNISRLKLLNAKGLGSISLLKKKPAYKRPVFLKNKFF